MTHPDADASRSTVIVIGPPASMVGGMARVVEQILELDFGARYRCVAFPTTFSSTQREGWHRRIRRHVRQLSLLARAIRRTRAGIVHVHTCSGFSFFRSGLDIMVARWLGCRAVVHVHGAAFDAFHADSGRAVRRVIAWLLTRADCVVALSESWRRKLRRMAPGARVRVIENAVPTQDRLPPRRHDGPCRFLLLARMDEWKGIDDLLRACRRVHEEGVALELVLAGPPGTAGDGAALHQKIRALHLDSVVRYVGTVHGNRKRDLFRRADAYVQPSHHEGMPLSLLEALSYGLAVVATRVGAVPEVVTDQREGLLVPPRRADLLASAIRELAKDPCRRESMGRAARELASTRFSMDRFRQDLVDLYDDLLATQPDRERTRKRSSDGGAVAKACGSGAM